MTTITKRLTRIGAVLALAAASTTLTGNTGLRTNVDARLLAAHNRERAALNIAPLAWDARLAADARAYAAQLARTNSFGHSDQDDENPVGENLFAGTTGYYAPEAMVGAGTLLSEGQILEAREAGARFLVSPGATPRLAEAAARSGLPYLPGCATVSEAMALLELGFTVAKFFPAEASGGIAFLRGIAPVLRTMRFCPTGGIDAAKARDYLRLPNVPCVGGSWLAPAEAVAAGDWGAITALARESAALRG